MLRFSLILPRLNAASVDKDTHHRIVEPLLALNLVGKHSEEQGGATFVLGGVTCHEIVVVESSALAARDDTMLPSVLASVIHDQKSRTLVLVLRSQPLSTLKPRPTILW